jgi:hypothetical protein
VELAWSTAAEINSDFAELKRSYDSKNWISLAEIQMKGNSQEVVNYNYTDYVASEELVYYQLRFVDFDGSEEFSPIISTLMGEQANEASLFPNPASSNITIQAESSDVQIYSVTGKRVVVPRALEVADGVFNLNIAHLEPGMYYVKNASGEQTFRKF